jgi:hypothetical protein
MSFLEKLQTRWKLKSLTQVILVLIVFACTGFTVLYLKKPLFWLLGVTEQMNPYLRTLIYVVTILPAYQVILLVYGFIFGQFHFFWEFEKKMLQRMGIMKKKTEV